MPRPIGGAGGRHLRHGARVVDQTAQLGEVGGVEEPRDRHVRLRRVGEERVAVAVGQPRRFHMPVQTLRAERPADRRLEPLQDAEDLQHVQARAVGRALQHLHAAPGRADRLHEFGDLQPGGEIGLGVQPARVPQRRHHGGRDLALVEGARPALGDRAQGAAEFRLDEAVADRRRLAAREETPARRLVAAQLLNRAGPVEGDAGVDRPALLGAADRGAEQLAQLLATMRPVQERPGGDRARHGHGMGRGRRHRLHPPRAERLRGRRGGRPAGAVQRDHLPGPAGRIETEAVAADAGALRLHHAEHGAPRRWRRRARCRRSAGHRARPGWRPAWRWRPCRRSRKRRCARGRGNRASCLLSFPP